MTGIAERPSDFIDTSVRNSLRSFGDRLVLFSALAAEHLRAMIFGAALSPTHVTASQAVHTLRLLTSARRAIDLVQPPRKATDQSTNFDICSETLNRMGILGDAANIGAGKWIPTPTRIVVADRVCLLLGSAPAPVIRASIGTEASCFAATRILDFKALDSAANRDIAQSVDGWFGKAPSLMAWTAEVIAYHESRMHATQGVAAEQLEIYAPDVLKGQHRSGRWIRGGEINRHLDGIRLYRPQLAYARSYDTPHYLGHFKFKSGALSLQRSVSIDHDLTLRLRFGLDIILKTPRAFQIVDLGETLRVDRPPPLPDPEARIFALGWPDHASETPDRLVFHRDALSILLHATQRLSIAPSVMKRSLA